MNFPKATAAASPKKWASCEHGRRNLRVCVECWQHLNATQLPDSSIAPFINTDRQPPSVLTDEYHQAQDTLNRQTNQMPEALPAKMEIQLKQSLESNFARLIAVSDQARSLPFFSHSTAIDRRDHEWQPRAKTPTHLNLQTFNEYDRKYAGWHK